MSDRNHKIGLDYFLQYVYNPILAMQDTKCSWTHYLFVHSFFFKLDSTAFCEKKAKQLLGRQI